MLQTGLICFATFLFTLFCLYFTQLSTWLKRKLSKNVVCWFCHIGSRVKMIDSNSWTCSSCGQYNGFTKDGGYNREIPGQSDEGLNIRAGTFSRCSPQFKRSNSLCPQCNYNQELKIKQLAAFQPLSQSNYDKEILHFRQQLEESYKLCTKCERLVASVISSQKYVLPGPRRLALITSSIVFKSSWSLCASMILCLMMGSNRLLTLNVVREFLLQLDLPDSGIAYLADPASGQILSGLGVIIHTLQCCQFGTYWSFVNWLVWAAMASSPHFLQSQQPYYITVVQVVMSLGLLISTGIILGRRKRMEKSIRSKEEQRNTRRRKENSTAVWMSTNHSPSQPPMENRMTNDSKKREPLLVRLSPSSSKLDDNGAHKRKIIKPVAKMPQMRSNKEDLDISTLSISGRSENPFNKGASPWDRVPMTRCSSYSSGISSMRTSPCSWKTTKDFRGSPENPWSKSATSSPSEDWTKTSLKESTFREHNDSWSPVPSYYNWDLKKSSWPAQVYSYPVAYSWPSAMPPWDGANINRPIQDNSAQSKTNIFLSSLPTVILAATNAFLVYYILHNKT